MELAKILNIIMTIQTAFIIVSIYLRIHGAIFAIVWLECTNIFAASSGELNIELGQVGIIVKTFLVITVFIATLHTDTVIHAGTM